MWIFSLLLAGWVIIRGILPLRLHWGWKAGLAAAALLTAFKFHILYLLGGPRFFAPNLPGTVILVSAWLYIILFIFFFLLLGSELIRGGICLYMLARKIKRTERFRIIGNRINAGLLAVACLMSTLGIWNGTSTPAVKEQRIVIRNLPSKLNGLTIAVIADLHIDGLSTASDVEKIVRKANSLQPDLIATIGDFVDGTIETEGKKLLPLRALSAKYGVYGVPGNHEYYSGYTQWRPFIEGLGIVMLENRHVSLLNGKLILAGVTDPVASRRGGTAPDVGSALKNSAHNVTKILLSHQPRLAPDAAKHGVDLQISGHTHGGMILGLNYLVAKFNRGFVSGVYRIKNMTLYVSNGTGIWSGFPVRLGVPSEITLFRLSNKPQIDGE
jgi:predicted MPP superfamily phosphohydrolase